MGALRETPGHANDFEAPVAQVVSFLGVEGEDAICQRLIGGDQCSDLLEPQHLPGSQSVTAIRRPQSAIFTAHDDQRIQKSCGLVDLYRQPLRVGGR